LKESRKETGKLFAKTKMGLIQEASVLWSFHKTMSLVLLSIVVQVPSSWKINHSWNTMQLDLSKQFLLFNRDKCGTGIWHIKCILYQPFNNKSFWVSDMEQFQVPLPHFLTVWFLTAVISPTSFVKCINNLLILDIINHNSC
jgi:hypothetical protein